MSMQGSDDCWPAASTIVRTNRQPRVLLVGLLSERYPAIGESHGLSVLGGVVRERLGSRLEALEIVDLVGFGEESCAPVLEAIERIRPTVTGIGLQYGTFSVLQREYPRLNRALRQQDHLMVFGGPLATYLGNDLLTEIDPAAVVVEGEGDEAFPMVIERWLEHDDFLNIPNLRYRATGRVTTTCRRLAALENVPSPAREHSGRIFGQGGQLFVESSRACSWAACTFCLRGLTDIEGRSREYRRFPVGRLVADLRELHSRGIRSVTFADEDMLGGPLEEVEEFVAELCAGLRRHGFQMRFDASITTHSAFCRRDDLDIRARKLALVGQLQEAGLRKVFLGVESGSASQLRRYAKGHTPFECARAVQCLRGSGIAVEIGFIMFDPLCTITEVRESISFLRANSLIGAVSALASELRLQTGSKYLRILEEQERRLGRRLFDRTLDRDTLSHEYCFVDPGINELVQAVRTWTERARPVYYPLKNLSRYGATGALGDAAPAIRRSLIRFRECLASSILAATQVLQAGESAGDAMAAGLLEPLRELGETFLSLEATSLPDAVKSHPVVVRLRTAARELMGTGALRTPMLLEPVPAPRLEPQW